MTDKKPNVEYSDIICQLLKDKELKKLKKIDTKKIGYVKDIIYKEGLSCEQLETMLIISENEVEKVNDIISETSLAIAAAALFGTLISNTFKNNEHEYAMSIFTSVLSVIFIILLILYPLRFNKGKRETNILSCIQISIGELLDESKKDNEHLESYNHCIEEIKKEFQDFKNQNNRLINITKKIEGNQKRLETIAENTNKGFLSRLFNR